MEHSTRIIALIHSKLSNEALRTKLLDYHENDIAAIFAELTPFDRKRLYHILSEETLSEIFSYLEDAEPFLKELGTEKAVLLLESMDTDDAVDLLEDLEEKHRNALLAQMEEEMVEEISLIHSYEADEIGSAISTNYIVVNQNETVKSVMKTVIQEAAENDNIKLIFVNQADDTYYGLIELRDLILARKDTPLEEIIKTSFPAFYATQKIENTIEDLKEYALPSAPVLDEEHCLIGVITTEDILEMVRDEMNDDYMKFAGVQSEEALHESLWRSIGKRIPWLLTLLVLGLLIAVLISSFEGVLSSLPVIIFFQSVILGMSGNAGTQSLAVTLRTLTEEQLSKKQSVKVLLREIGIGFGNGLLIAIIGFLVVIAFLFLGKPILEVGENRVPLDFNQIVALKVGVSFSLSILIAMTLSSLFGALIPMFFKRIKVDPAVASGPLITTINDVVGIVVYYGIAWLLILVLI